MAISQLPQAPYRQDRRVYPTPIIGDVLFSEVRDCTRIEIPEYGTAHPNSGKWPDHKLVFVKTVDIERDGIFEFFYAAERENQDLYNFSSGYRNVVGNAGGREFRVVQRSYVTLRDKFEPTDIEFGTPMMDVPEGKFDDVEYVFFDRQQQQIQEQELNALFVAEVHTYIEKAFLEYKLSYGTQKSEVVPEKFRALIPQTTTEQIVEGLAEQPILTGSQLSVTEDQINPDIKVVKTVSRADQQTGYALNGKQVTNVLQVADVVETIVPDGTTVDVSELTIDGSVEPLGNGQSLQRVITAPELFTSESYSVERPDLVPEKFRAITPTITEESNIVGVAAKPVLNVGELAATEQQQNKFVKRSRKTKRDLTTLPKSLTQKVTTNDKQVAIVTETLQVGDASIEPSATVDIESQALGDGTYIIRQTEVPDVFSAETFSKQRLSSLPEKFKSSTTTKQKTISGLAGLPALGANDIAGSQQQINNFVFRDSITTINNPDAILDGKQSYVGGTVATVSEKLSDSPDIETGFLVEESTSTALGEGKYLTQTVKVDGWPTLISANWDDTINALSIQKQTVKDNKTLNELSIPNTSNTKTYKAVNKDRTVLIEDYAPKEIDTYVSLTKTRINLNLPPVLQKINVIWETGMADGSYEEEGVSEAESVIDGSISVSTSGTATGSVSVQPVLDIVMEQIWSSDIIATNYFYFVKDPESYLSKLNSMRSSSNQSGGSGGTGGALLAGQTIQLWPVFKTKSYSINTSGTSIETSLRYTESISKSVSEDREALGKTKGKGDSRRVTISGNSLRIGPCLCQGFTINTEHTESAFISTPDSTITISSSGRVSPSSFAATSPTDVPRTGLYAVDSRIEPYKWGYYKVITTVIDAAVFGEKP